MKTFLVFAYGLLCFASTAFAQSTEVSTSVQTNVPINASTNTCPASPTLVCRPTDIAKKVPEMFKPKGFDSENPNPYHCALEWNMQNPSTGECSVMSAEMNTPDYFKDHPDSISIIGHGVAKLKLIKVGEYNLALRSGHVPTLQGKDDYRKTFTGGDDVGACLDRTARAYAAKGGPNYTFTQTCSTFSSYLLSHCGVNLSTPDNQLSLPTGGTAPGWREVPKFKKACDADGAFEKDES